MTTPELAMSREPRRRRPPGEHPPLRRAPTFLRSLGYALDGIGYLFRTQRNAQIHAVAAALVFAAAWLFGISALEWLALLAAITVVIVAEGLNTAVEAVVDLVSPDYHQRARHAKDVAAGAVLLAAAGAAAIGALVFVPRMWQLVLR
jgi:diacylglycerol kinase